MPTGDDEAMATEVVVWNAVNFGSGWFPVLRKRDGLSGARSLAEALADHVSRQHTHRRMAGPSRRSTCAEVFGQLDPGPVDDLLDLFACAGATSALLADRFGGRAELVWSAGGSAAALVGTLATMPLAHDVAVYRLDGEPFEVPFHKGPDHGVAPGPRSVTRGWAASTTSAS